MIKYIRFNQQFDAEQLKREVAQVETALWQDHYNRSNYEGGWSTIQLRSLHGQVANNTAVHAGGLPAGNAFRDTPLLTQCPYIKGVIDFFQIEKTSIRLMKLDAGAIIKPHSDHNLNFEEGEVRIHVPVITNPQLKFYLEEERLVMEEGSCWYLNLSRQHQVINDGPTARVHLVIDGIVNDWLKAYFHSFPHGQVAMALPQTDPAYSRDDQLRIIEQLRLLKTTVADKLANEMQAALPPRADFG
ncbi:hypothetical protein ACVWYF_003631 [Hymenobacter sp. UYAg731]